MRTLHIPEVHFSDEIAIMIRHYVIHPYLKIRHYVIVVIIININFFIIIIIIIIIIITVIFGTLKDDSL